MSKGGGLGVGGEIRDCNFDRGTVLRCGIGKCLFKVSEFAHSWLDAVT